MPADAARQRGKQGRVDHSGRAPLDRGGLEEMENNEAEHKSITARRYAFFSSTFLRCFRGRSLAVLFSVCRIDRPLARFMPSPHGRPNFRFCAIPPRQVNFQ